MNVLYDRKEILRNAVRSVKSFSLFLVPIDIWEIFLKHHPRFISMVAIKEARKKEEKVHSISSDLVHRLGKNYPRVKE